MKIGEVRVAEDSDFALLKVTFNIIIVETIVVLNFIIFTIAAIMIRKSSTFPREKGTLLVNRHFYLGF